MVHYQGALDADEGSLMALYNDPDCFYCSDLEIVLYLRGPLQFNKAKGDEMERKEGRAHAEDKASHHPLLASIFQPAGREALLRGSLTGSRLVLPGGMLSPGDQADVDTAW